MTKLDLYNLVLSLFNMDPLEQADIDDTVSLRHQDVATLDRWYNTALRKVSREHRWPFLEQKVELGQDLGPAHGYEHSYEVPKDLFSITWADGERYRFIGTVFCTDGDAEAFGLMKNIIPEDDSMVPDDFYDLLALSLAYFTAYRFAPDLKKTIAQDYQSVLLTMVSDMLRHGQKDREVFDAF